MWNKTVTLYIDDTSLRLLVVRGQRVIKWGEMLLEPGWIKGSVVMEPAAVAGRIKQLLKDQKVQVKKVGLGFSGLHSMTRPAVLPEMPRAMLAEAVVREARRVLPVPLEQVYLSWRTLPSPRGKIRVFLTAIPRQTADSLVKTLHSTGLAPYHMAIKPLALTKLVPTNTAVIVDAQPKEFDIVILADGVAQPIRTVSFPDEDLSPEAKLNMIISDLDRTIKFYDANNPEKPLNVGTFIYVSGELAGSPEMQNSLAEATGHPVMTLKAPLKEKTEKKAKPGKVISIPMKAVISRTFLSIKRKIPFKIYFKIDLPQKEPRIQKAYQPISPPSAAEAKHFDPERYLVNIALAAHAPLPMRGPTFAVANLNVLPAPYQPKPISLLRVIGIPGGTAGVALVVPMVILMQITAANIDSMQKQLDTVNQLTNQKLVQKQTLNKAIEGLKKDSAAAKLVYDDLVLSLGALKTGQEIINGDLRLVLSIAPPSVTLTAINESQSQLTIQGRSSSEADILQYARELDLSGRFSETIIASIGAQKSKEGSGGLTFTLALKGKE